MDNINKYLSNNINYFDYFVKQIGDEKLFQKLNNDEVNFILKKYIITKNDILPFIKDMIKIIQIQKFEDDENNINFLNSISKINKLLLFNYYLNLDNYGIVDGYFKKCVKNIGESKANVDKLLNGYNSFFINKKSKNTKTLIKISHCEFLPYKNKLLIVTKFDISFLNKGNFITKELSLIFDLFYYDSNNFALTLNKELLNNIDNMDNDFIETVKSKLNMLLGIKETIARLESEFKENLKI